MSAAVSGACSSAYLHEPGARPRGRAGVGAVAGVLSDVGINDDFMKQLAES
ncbi:MAG: hypothetical protein ACLSTO_09085 [Bilophila wadsworthia]